jgi:hypothetical protein
VPVPSLPLHIKICYTAGMPAFGLMISIFAWMVFVLAALGLFFWASRWFPRQPWFGRSLLLGFVVLGLMARATKWAIPLLMVALLTASAFIPRKR